ncbi:MAG: MFS transporter [Chloroflexales bacterium]|nr:MFS transporter [Chloroflexales bacterium]
MYQVENSESTVRSQEAGRPRSRWWRLVSTNVLFLGLTSLFTDISSEMVATVLPLYIIFTLHLSPLQYGFIDGLYQGAAVLALLVSGIAADRWQRYKAVAAVGYGLSAICRLGLLLIGTSLGAIAALVMVDRTGKGIRTSPRDTLIALSTPPNQLATALGVHRAFDTAGSMLGPLVAFLLLSLAPGTFDAIFVVSFCFALIGVGILALFVEPRRADPATAAHLCQAKHQVGKGALRCASCRLAPHVLPGASLRAAIGLLRRPRFAMVVASGTALGLATLSDGFIYLNLQRQLDLTVGFFPLLYVVTSFIYMLLAVPAGRLADLFGRGRMFLAGNALLMIVYLLLLVPNIPSAALFSSVLFLGAYYAATDGVLVALASAMLPARLRASGLALLSTATGIARLCASVLFGILWMWVGAQGALVCFSLGLLATTLVTALSLRLVEPGSNGV